MLAKVDRLKWGSFLYVFFDHGCENKCLLYVFAERNGYLKHLLLKQRSEVFQIFLLQSPNISTSFVKLCSLSLFDTISSKPLFAEKTLKINLEVVKGENNFFNRIYGKWKKYCW